MTTISTRTSSNAAKHCHVWIWYGQGAVAPVQFSSVEGPMIARAQMLPGTIGYLDIRHFVGMTSQLDGAMAALKDSAALMIGLRLCVGGNVEIVQHLATYFFANRTHILSQVTRTSSKPIERWTLDEVPGQRVPDIPVYILTSRRTFSAAESFTVALRGPGRATVVGERTGGGGHS